MSIKVGDRILVLSNNGLDGITDGEYGVVHSVLSGKMKGYLTINLDFDNETKPNILVTDLKSKVEQYVPLVVKKAGKI